MSGDFCLPSSRQDIFFGKWPYRVSNFLLKTKITGYTVDI